MAQWHADSADTTDFRRFLFRLCRSSLKGFGDFDVPSSKELTLGLPQINLGILSLNRSFAFDVPSSKCCVAPLHFDVPSSKELTLGLPQINLGILSLNRSFAFDVPSSKCCVAPLHFDVPSSKELTLGLPQINLGILSLNRSFAFDVPSSKCCVARHSSSKTWFCTRSFAFLHFCTVQNVWGYAYILYIISQ